MKNAYLDIRTSIERFLISWSVMNLSSGQGNSLPTGESLGTVFYRVDEDKLYQMKTSGWQQINMDYYLFDFDNHSVETSYPEHPLIGIRAFSMIAEDKLFDVSFLVGLSYYAEPDLVKHNRSIGLLFNAFYPHNMIAMNDYNDNTGEEYQWMKITSGTEVFPVDKSEIRTFQFIGVTGKTGITTNVT